VARPRFADELNLRRGFFPRRFLWRRLAGVVALMLSVDPALTPGAIKDILADAMIDVTTGATALGDPAISGNDDATGAGFINAFAACQMTERLKNTGPDGPG
jgi:hypothetical protein